MLMIISVYVNANLVDKVEEVLKREYAFQGYHLSFLGQMGYNRDMHQAHLICGLDCMGGGNGVSDLIIFQLVAEIRLIDESASFMFR